MSEGLTPAEAAKELHHHQAATGHQADAHGSQWIAVVEAILLSLVTVTTAWAGYSAAKWSTESRLDLAAASAQRVEANRALAIAAEQRNFDASTFNAWFTAYVLGDTEKMGVAERRFRPAFAVAFDAWQATQPETNPDAPPGPTYMPEYRQPAKLRALRLDRAATASSDAGEHAGKVADDYVRITVLLATVLFLVGIGSTFRFPQVRYVLAVTGTTMLLVAVVLIAQQPRPR